MKSISIQYKDISFDVRYDEGTATSDSVRVENISNHHDNQLVNTYNDEVFFNKYLGETYDKEELGNLASSIKRSFSKFAREYTQDDETEEVSNEPVGAVDQIIFDTVGRALGSSKTKEKVDTLIKALIKEHGIVPHKTVLEVKFKDQPKKDVGLQHKSFADVLSTLSAGVNIALVGPAGSGKTTIVYNAAKILNLTFASQSVSAQSTVFDFFGYK